jgi:hypothetical protein
VSFQDWTYSALPESCLLPALKVRMNRAGRAKIAWQRLPLAGRAQNVKDGELALSKPRTQGSK